jgi:AraC-like DNA-binding protein
MSTAGDARILVHVPSGALRPVVKRILVVESTSARSDVHLPDTGLVAAFSFRGACRLDQAVEAPSAAITGLRDGTWAHDHSPDHAAVIVAFTAIGAAALLRMPLDEFANETMDLDAVLGRRAGVDSLHEQLIVAANDQQRIRLVEHFLLSQIRDFRPDPLVSAATALIERTRAMMRVDALAREVGLSQSALERRFRRLVGSSPRKFASLVRLQNVIRLRDAGLDLTAIAHTAGYCDQSHFIKDFKRFTGQAPRAFFARS